MKLDPPATQALRAAFRLFTTSDVTTHESGTHYTPPGPGRVASEVTDHRREKIRAMYRAGEKLKKIAEATHISTNMVRRHLKSMGLVK